MLLHALIMEIILCISMKPEQQIPYTFFKKNLAFLSDLSGSFLPDLIEAFYHDK